MKTKNIVRSLGALALAGALALPIYISQRKSPEEIQFQRLTQVWGEQWQTITPAKQEAIRKNYLRNELDRRILDGIYLNNNYLESLPQAERTLIESTNLTREETRAYEKLWPFIDSENPSEADKTFLGAAIHLQNLRALPR